MKDPNLRLDLATGDFFYDGHCHCGEKFVLTGNINDDNPVDQVVCDKCGTVWAIMADDWLTSDGDRLKGIMLLHTTKRERGEIGRDTWGLN